MTTKFRAVVIINEARHDYHFCKKQEEAVEVAKSCGLSLGHKAFVQTCNCYGDPVHYYTIENEQEVLK